MFPLAQPLSISKHVRGAQIAYNDIPIVLEEFQCQKYRYIEVPTGETECITQDEGSGRIQPLVKS